MRYTTLLFLLLFLSSSSFSQGYYFKKKSTNIVLLADGTFTVNESLDVLFEEKKRGIIRSIPTIYQVNGERRKVSIKKLKAKDEPQHVSTKSGNRVIRIGKESEFLVGPKSYEITYEVRNAISSYDDHDEFYWNIADFKTDTRTQINTFSISYPESWIGQIREFKSFSGPKGSTTNEIVIHEEGNKLIGALRTELMPYEGITFVAKIPKGLIMTGEMDRLSPSENKEKNWLVNLWNLVPLGFGGLLLFLFNKIEKSPPTTKDIHLQYHPPTDMSPAEVGTFYDHKVNKRDIISLLPYWGNQGILKISPVDGTKHDLSFFKKGNLNQDAKDYEHILFDKLFKNRDVVLLSDLKNEILQTLLSVSSKINKEVLQKDLYDERSHSIFHKGWMIGIGLISILIGVLLLIITKAIIAFIGLIGLGILCFFLHAKRPKLSAKGSEYLNHLRGFYTFLQDPSEDKIRSLEEEDPNYLHEVYPYVLAFDLDKTWTRALKTFQSVTPPLWYDSQSSQKSDFGYQTISDDLNVRNIEQVFYSSPSGSRSSSGGGFSGGSAGGGFGGGSTSSW